MQISYVNLADQHKPIKQELLAAVGNVIDSGKFILGDIVAEFESRFAELCGVRYAVGVNSGTDALILALKALGVGPGDEVITVPNSFIATAAAAALIGAKPVFVDVGEDFNMDPALIERAISDRTRAILPVHLTGRPADMDPILEIARARRLFVVEDCAQAILAEYRGKRVGSFGHVGCFSLHPLKTLNACGDGGMLVTDDGEMAERFKVLRNVGSSDRDEYTVWSGNSRLDSLQAAILMVKLDHLQAWTAGRRANAGFYRERLAALPEVRTPAERAHERAVYHTFVIQAERRDELKAHLADLGIGTAIHYKTPIHLQAAARDLGHIEGSFPVTEEQARRILSLPIYPQLSERELNYIVDGIYSFYEGN